MTSGPGLVGALLVGVAAAKALALGLDKPLYGVNHLSAHVAVDQLEHGPLPEPCLAMLVSGGHSSLLLVEDVTAGVEPLGATIDDAAGEAFDKVARLLGLPFPGGPHIDRAAASGLVGRDRLPARPDLAARPGAAPLRLLLLRAQDRCRPLGRGAQAAGGAVPVADVAASFQEAVCDVLTRKAVDAAVDRGVEDILIGGGVAANSRLRVHGRGAGRAARDPGAGAAPGAVHRQRRHGGRARRRDGRPGPHPVGARHPAPTRACPSPTSWPETVPAQAHGRVATGTGGEAHGI